MHASVMDFVRRTVDEYDLSAKSVLEVGSLDVNGSPRSLFTGDYYGIDTQAGPGVDEQMSAHDLCRPIGRPQGFDVIVCTEMLEHDTAPWLSVLRMHEVVTPLGYLILTARGYDERGSFPLHDYPSDLWRFSVAGAEWLLRGAGWEPITVERDPEHPGFLALARA